jgi:hypothetical protein
MKGNRALIMVQASRLRLLNQGQQAGIWRARWHLGGQAEILVDWWAAGGFSGNTSITWVGRWAIPDRGITEIDFHCLRLN